MQLRDRTNKYTTPKSSFRGSRSLSHAPTMSVLLEQCQSGRKKPSPWNWSVNSMEPAVFRPIHGDFGRQPQERCWEPMRINLEEMKLKIAKIAKSRRVADQVEAVAERRGDGFKELSGGALN